MAAVRMWYLRKWVVTALWSCETGANLESVLGPYTAVKFCNLENHRFLKYVGIILLFHIGYQY